MKNIISTESKIYLLRFKRRKTWLAISLQGLLAAGLVVAVEPNTRTFTADKNAKVKGVIVSHDGNTLKVRDSDDNALSTVDLSDSTNVRLRGGFLGLGGKSMESSDLVPGLRVEADGKGDAQGNLAADKVTFDRTSERTSRQVDARVGPIESRTGEIANNQGKLQTRAGQIENRQGELESTQKQTQMQVGQVRTTAEQANQGVTNVNQRVSDLDNYKPTASTTVYFKIDSSVLSDDAKKDLDDIAQKALASKGYAVEVAGFADTTGNMALNQRLSQDRANSVMHYLEQQGNIPIPRVITPAGMGTSHAVADNDTRAGRKMNRRVEVTLLVNQGLAGGTDQTGSNPPVHAMEPEPNKTNTNPTGLPPNTTGSQTAPSTGSTSNPPQQ